MTELNEPSTLPNSQRAPDLQLSRRQNELICEKLLRWQRRPSEPKDLWYSPEDGKRIWGDSPSFTNWAEAGLILDVLQKLSYDKRLAADVLVLLGDRLIGALLTPADIRAAALDYIKQSMGWHTYLKAVKS